MQEQAQEAAQSKQEANTTKKKKKSKMKKVTKRGHEQTTDEVNGSPSDSGKQGQFTLI